MVMLGEGCSAIFQNKLPTKKKDPGSITIRCVISDLVNEKALGDLGASINVMPYTIFKKLGLSDMQPIRITLQLADQYIRYPRGIIEDELIKVDKFLFPVDFVILDVTYSSKHKIPDITLK